MNISQYKVMIVLIGLCFWYNSLAIADQQMDSLLIEARNELYRAYDNVDDTKLLQSKATLENLLSIHPGKWLVHYYIALSNSYLSTFYLQKEDAKKLKNSIDDGIEHVSQCIRLNKNFADGYILQSELYGIKIALDPFMGNELNEKIFRNYRIVNKIDPNNPRQYLIAGIFYYFTPKNYGGAKDTAKIYLKKALDLFPEYKVPLLTYPDWGYEETYVWLGQIAEKEDSLKLAQAYYQKVLNLEPDNPWVKYELMPKLQEKIAGQSDFDWKKVWWLLAFGGFIGVCFISVKAVKRSLISN